MFKVFCTRRAIRRGVGTAMLLAATIAAVPTMATAAETQARTVKIADLNLASPSGRQILDRRLRLAIEQVCLPRKATGIRPSVKQVNACRRAAKEDVQRQLADRGLAQLLAADF